MRGMPLLRVIGPGRAGRSFAAALAAVGWEMTGFVRRGDDVTTAAHGVDLLLIATPDAAIAAVAAGVEPDAGAVVAHCAGSLGLDVVAPHRRRAALHPLVSLPNADVGAARLRDGAWFAVAGDALARDVVAALGGRAVDVPDERRASYHAAASIAANHVTAVLAQAERVAVDAGVPFEAYMDLVRSTVENVTALGAVAALTGPAARGDTTTVARHVAALPADERPLYETLAAECRRLAGWR
jgi:predicted short-subunit dehydrogenase-like oxidoreductase (DUF2520 family)